MSKAKETSISKIVGMTHEEACNDGKVEMLENAEWHRTQHVQSLSSQVYAAKDDTETLIREACRVQRRNRRSERKPGV